MIIFFCHFYYIMTSIFNLPDNVDNAEEKLDLDDLYERKKQADLSNLELFNKILSKIHQKIKKHQHFLKTKHIVGMSYQKL